MVEVARIYDFDDTIVDRGKLPRLGGLIAGSLHRHQLRVLTLDDISSLELDHNSVTGTADGLAERISLRLHSDRQVFPQARQALLAVDPEEIHVYGATGRSNKDDWVDMTRNTLDGADILGCFQRIFYTPEGVRPTISKAHVVWMLGQQYPKLEFNDDDPRTIWVLAQLFPLVQFNYHRHRITDRLPAARELDQFANVHIIPAFR